MFASYILFSSFGKKETTNKREKHVQSVREFFIEETKKKVKGNGRNWRNHTSK
jgi:hypothetical protein